MAWYWWVLIGWVLSGFIALAMNIRDNPRLRENLDLDDAWPVLFGPVWLMVKIRDWFRAWGTR